VLSDGPAVEEFVHHEKSFTIAEIEEFRRGRIVGSANGVDAERAKIFEAAIPDIERHGRAERGAVVMQADAVQFEIPSVQRKSVGGVEAEFADAERRGVFVETAVVVAKRGLDVVERRMIEVPALRMADAEFLDERSVGAFGDRLRGSLESF